MIGSPTRVWQRICLYVVGVSALGVVGLCAWPYTVDDAYIVARYAVRISQAQGYTFNGGRATDGVTGPAWLLPGILAARLGWDPVACAKFTGLACCVWASLWCMREQRQRARGSCSAPVTALLLVCQPSLAGSGVSGLETGAATLAVTAAVSAALTQSAAKPMRLGFAIAGLAWLRPELAAISLLLLVIVQLRVGSWGALPAWVLAGAGAVGVCAFREHIAGSLWPLAWHAKAGSLSDGAAYTARAVPIVSGVLGLGLCAAASWRGQRRDRARMALLLVHACAVTLAGGDWMPGFRLFVPVLPQYASLAGVGAERWWRQGPALRALVLVALLMATGVPLLDLALRIPEWRAAGASRERVGTLIAQRLRAESKSVALVDIGFLGYQSGCEIVDLAGVTDPEVAAMPGGHLDKHIPSAWLAARAPDTLLLHSSMPPLAAVDGHLIALRGYPVEMRIARSAWLRREFALVATYDYAPGYTYALLRQVRSPAH